MYTDNIDYMHKPGANQGIEIFLALSQRPRLWYSLFMDVGAMAQIG